MNVLRLFAFTAGSLFFLSCLATVAGAKDEKQQRQLQKGLLLPISGGGGPLLTQDTLDKLKLSADQKEKYDKINSEYQDKAKASAEKVQEAYRTKDKEKIKEAIEGNDGAKLRTEYLGKVEPILNVDQKKIFEEVKTQRAGFGTFQFAGQAIPGQLLPSGILDKLKLTDDQRKKIADAQKEAESKIMNVLTEEQKKQLEEIKKAPGIIKLPDGFDPKELFGMAKKNAGTTYTVKSVTPDEKNKEIGTLVVTVEAAKVKKGEPAPAAEEKKITVTADTKITKADPPAKGTKPAKGQPPAGNPAKFSDIATGARLAITLKGDVAEGILILPAAKKAK